VGRSCRGRPVQSIEYKSEHYASQPTPRTALAAMITRMDRDVGRVLSLIQELGIDDNTIVFFTSDNGGYRLAEEFFRGNGGLLGAKGEFYEGGVRVPLVVRWPGVCQGRADLELPAAQDGLRPVDHWLVTQGSPAFFQPLIVRLPSASLSPKKPSTIEYAFL
jgi:sulfatase-like protein